MIKSLTIQNFQSHEDTRLDFVPGVNIIIGKTDSGKSVIVRALRWGTDNKPNGSDFRSHWGGVVSVGIEMEEGSVIHTKDKQDKYILQTPDGVKFEFNAIGTGVPEEVVKLLNLSPLNFQYQFDPHFLLSSTPGAVAQHFNKVANLDEIDHITQKVNSQIRELNTAIKAKEIQEAEFAEQLQTYDYLPKFELAVEALESLESRFNTQVKLTTKLQSTLNDLQRIDEEIAEHNTLLPIETLVTNLLSWNNKLEERSTQYDTLNDLIISISEIEQGIELSAHTLLLEPTLLQLDKSYKEVVDSQKERKRLSKAISSCEDVRVQIQKEKERQQELEAEFEELFPDRCPLCGKPK